MSWSPRNMPLYQSLADVVIANTAVETTTLSGSAASGLGLPTPMVPKNYPAPGTKLQLTAWGAYKIPTLLSGIKLTFKITLGGSSFTVDIPTALFTLLNLTDGSEQPCYFNLTLKYNTVGPAAQVKRFGSLAFLDTSGNFKYQTLRGPNLPIDTTVDCPFDATAKWSAANAAASLTVDSAELALIG